MIFRYGLLIAIGLSILGCNNYLTSPCNCASVEEVAYRLVGRDTAVIATDTALAHCYTLKDSLFGDERTKWHGIALKQDGQTVAFAECHTQDATKIARFTVVGKGLATKEGLYPSMLYINAKPYLSKGKFVMAPDGYLMIKDPHNSKITYTLQVSGYPAIYTGTNDFNAIPDSVFIEKIVVNDR